MAESPRTSVYGRHQSTDLDDALAFRIHRTNRLLRTHLGRFLERHAPGLSPEQWFVLARVRQLAPVRQATLSEPVLGDPPNVSRLVDSLVGRGLVQRSPDPADRRSRLLSLTEAGHSLASVLLENAVKERELVFHGLHDDELALLAGLLDRIDDNVRRLLATGRPSAAGQHR